MESTESVTLAFNNTLHSSLADARISESISVQAGNSAGFSLREGSGLVSNGAAFCPLLIPIRGTWSTT